LPNPEDPLAVDRALKSLAAERDRLKSQLNRLESAIALLSGEAKGRRRAPARSAARKRTRRARSAEQRRAQSERMKAWWAARKGNQTGQEARPSGRRKRKARSAA
jgi:hypothetical protein